VIGVEDAHHQPVILRLVADHAHLQVAFQNLDGDPAGLAAPNLHLHTRIQLAVARDERQKVQSGRFVGTDEQPSRTVVT